MSHADADLNVYFSHYATVDVESGPYLELPRDDPRTGIHTRAESGPIAVRHADEINLCSNSGAARDLALIRLDRRIPMEVVLPAEPPVIERVESCRDRVDDITDFSGRTVGYGDVVLAGPQSEAFRSSATADDWERVVSGSGERFYRNRFLLDATGSIVPGDSGGALFASVSGRDPLCGIISRQYPILLGVIGSSTAAIDSRANIAFMRDAGVFQDDLSPLHGFADGDGLLGRCERQDCAAPDADGDTVAEDGQVFADGDGWPDCCDNCPTVRNEDQTDTDGDGIGDACDLCPRHPSRDASNANLETEVAVHYGQGETEPPEAFLQQRDRILPDACAPSPVAMADSTSEFLGQLTGGADSLEGHLDSDTGALPRDVYLDARGVGDAPSCAALPGFRDCTPLVRNRIDVERLWLAHPEFRVERAGTAAPLSGTYGFRHCECAGHDTATAIGRARCRVLEGCTAGELLTTTSNPAWNVIPVRRVEDASETWPVALLRAVAGFDALYTGNFDDVRRGVADASYLWDFTALPYCNGSGCPRCTSGACGSGRPQVHGVLWSQVVGFPTFATPVPGGTVEQRFASLYESGTAGVDVRATVASAYRSLLGSFFFADDRNIVTVKNPCVSSLTCPFGVGDLLAIRSNPTEGFPGYVLSHDGDDWYVPDGDPAMSFSLTSTLARVAAGEETVVNASEPFSRLAQRGVVLRSVTLDAEARPATVLVAGFDGRLDTLFFCETPGCDEANIARLPTSEVVLSAEQQHLYTFGDGRTSVAQGAFTLESPPAFTVSHHPIEPASAPGDVVAGTWCMDDQRLYSLERLASGLRLSRWRHGETAFDAVATLPPAYDAFDRFFLTHGPEGDLVLTAVRAPDAPGGALTVLVRFRLTGHLDRQVALLGIATVPRAVLVEPTVGSSAVLLLDHAPPAGPFRYLSVPLADFGDGPAAFRPDVLHAPSCQAAVAAPAVLWPPNHKLRPVRIEGVTDGDGEALAITVTRVRQNEVLHAPGSGATDPDAFIDASGVRLRAERAGPGPGRIYELDFTATDPGGKSCKGRVSVCVPHHAGAACPDEEAQIVSTRSCAQGGTCAPSPPDGEIAP